MRLGRLFWMTILILSSVSVRAIARPVTYKGALAISTLNQTFQTDNTLGYGFAREAAIAARLMKFDDRSGKMSFYAPQLNFRLQRWNGDGYQANLYATSAVGMMVHDNLEHSAISTALETDAETRQLYLSLAAEKMWTGVDYDFWHLRARTGFAPYAAGFKQIATWILVQYDQNPLLRGRHKVTPFVRLNYQEYLLELGGSNNDNWMINFLVTL